MSTASNPPGVWRPFGPFSMAVVQGAGRVVHLKGQVALDIDGRVVGPGDMRVQTRKTLENLRAVLAGLGGEMAHILSLAHYVTDIDAFMQTRDIRLEFFAEPYPATTTVQVVRLFDPRLIVEIAGIAEIPSERFKPPCAPRAAGAASGSARSTAR
jgi:2-iminobutanoate/2-iminopropanoate deaminase